MSRLAGLLALCCLLSSASAANERLMGVNFTVLCKYPDYYGYNYLATLFDGGAGGVVVDKDYGHSGTKFKGRLEGIAWGLDPNHRFLIEVLHDCDDNRPRIPKITEHWLEMWCETYKCEFPPATIQL